MKLFTVGPVQMDPAISAIAANALPYFRTEKFSELALGIERDLLRCLDAPSGSHMVSLTSSGTGAMEACVGNLFGPSDKVLVIQAGAFGQRFCEICDRLCIPYDVVVLPFGKNITACDLEPFSGEAYAGVLMNAHETSTGVLLDTHLVSAFARAASALLISDAISTFLTDPYSMADLTIDASIISSHKALGLHPGMAFVALSPRAIERVTLRSKRAPHSLYFDLLKHLHDGQRGQSPWTPAISILLQMRERLNQILEKGVTNGVENEIKRHRGLAADFRQRAKMLPLSITSNSLSNCVTPLSPINGMSAFEITRLLDKQHDISILPSGGELKDKLLRVGHIGYLTTTDNEQLISALSKILHC